ncbi:hypothetical protein MAIC_10820 [Mycolicibacterium aichiense]|uniref:Uncharacterized protein n=1 Tax=Mycolicibacterium aichiense TaxID=1799 RepID=A0AAD1HKC6_9MYCO|nr:hypothetical protein MAIC_10820 [Mycolicibacterium aichiense]
MTGNITAVEPSEPTPDPHITTPTPTTAPTAISGTNRDIPDFGSVRGNGPMTRSSFGGKSIADRVTRFMHGR